MNRRAIRAECPTEKSRSFMPAVSFELPASTPIGVESLFDRAGLLEVEGIAAI